MSSSNMTPIEIERTHAEIAKLMAETVKLNTEAAKMARERAWYPVVLMTGALAAGAAIAKLLT
ncbi:MAG: hypothetical protein GXY45_11680 [Ramlibacter sp.]|nr:hypothetical protein [Ramlibacter sp.]